MSVGLGIFVAIVSIIFIVLFLMAIIGVFIRNSLVRKRNEVENTYAGISVQLKKRYDLIPNLVSVVQKYAQHEKSILEEITKLRSQALDKNIDNNNKVDLDNKISKAMGNVLMTVENYPILKASDSFIALQRSLNEIEAQLSASRRYFNTAVTEYNNAIQVAPNNFIADIMHLTAKNVFEISETEKQNIDVKKLLNS